MGKRGEEQEGEEKRLTFDNILCSRGPYESAHEIPKDPRRQVRLRVTI